jgi:hypothetical protein
MAGAANYLGWRQAHTAHPSKIGVRNPQILVKYDNFLCEVVEYALKTIAHPLSFFQEPTPVVPRDHQTKAKAHSQGQMVQEQIEYWGVQHGRYGVRRGPKDGGPDESHDEGESYATSS